MAIPHAERAVVNIRKLRDYGLNPLHDEGQHKARLFATALGMTADDAEALHAPLLQAVTTADAQLGRHDAYGQRYTVDVFWHGGTSVPWCAVGGLSNMTRTPHA